jgi:4'-phosphopantetheinyl transferase
MRALHLWLAPTPPRTPCEAVACRTLMSEDEREREVRFRFERDRRLYRLSRAYTRSLLSRYVGVDPRQLRFRVGPAGKPELAFPAGSAFTFSLAHTHGMVVLLVSRDRTVGADVERERRFTPSQLNLSLLGPSEVAELRRLAPQRRPARFVEYWVLKESYAKARGAGLELPLHHWEFIIEAKHIRLRCDSAPEPEAQLWWFSLPPRTSGFVTAIAAALHATDEAPPDLTIFSLAQDAE